MSSTAQAHHQPGLASRRFGYVVAAGLNVLMLYLTNGRPGWEAVPFLTADTTRVLMLVNLSMVAGVVINSARLFYDSRWFVSLGDLVSTFIGIAALVRIWRVFPFDFGAYSVNWGLVVRVLLVVALVGSLIGIVAQTVTTARAIAGGSPGAGRAR